MAVDRSRGRRGEPDGAAPGRGVPRRRIGSARRPEEHPTWVRALNGIGWVVAMAIVVALVGLALSWLATIVL